MNASLSPYGREILDFETHMTFHHRGSKEQAMWDLFGLTAIRYYYLLLDLVNRPEALAYAPVTVNRIRAKREAGRQARQARADGIATTLASSRALHPVRYR